MRITEINTETNKISLTMRSENAKPQGKRESGGDRKQGGGGGGKV